MTKYRTTLKGIKIHNSLTWTKLTLPITRLSQTRQEPLGENLRYPKQKKKKQNQKTKNKESISHNSKLSFLWSQEKYPKKQKKKRKNKNKNFSFIWGHQIRHYGMFQTSVDLFCFSFFRFVLKDVLFAILERQIHHQEWRFMMSASSSFWIWRPKENIDS